MVGSTWKQVRFSEFSPCDVMRISCPADPGGFNELPDKSLRSEANRQWLSSWCWSVLAESLPRIQHAKCLEWVGNSWEQQHQWECRKSNYSAVVGSSFLNPVWSRIYLPGRLLLHRDDYGAQEPDNSFRMMLLSYISDGSLKSKKQTILNAFLVDIHLWR